jgi:hypothetical protein
MLPPIESKLERHLPWVGWLLAVAVALVISAVVTNVLFALAWLRPSVAQCAVAGFGLLAAFLRRVIFAESGTG